MSHLTVSSIQIKDIDALKSAAKTFGGVLEQSKVFTSYTGDSNPCEYRIKLPGVRYQVGILKQDSAWVLSHDPYGYEANGSSGRHDGHKLVEVFGAGLGKLSQAYSRAVVMKKAIQKGWMVQTKTLPDGKIRMQLIST